MLTNFSTIHPIILQMWTQKQIMFSRCVYEMSLNSVQIEMAALMADWRCTPTNAGDMRKKPKKSDSFPAFLCKITNLQEASDCIGTMSDETNQPDAMPVFMINITKFQCALWLKHLAAHLWKPMFFNETLVIKWIPWLFHHKTAGEDKTTCVICAVVDPRPSFHRPFLFPLFCIFPLCLPFIPSNLFSHFASQNEPLL